jgi:glycerol-3-phosphate dehydrogenase
MLNAVRELSFADPEETWWCAEALHAIEHTMCMHLSDFYLRRTPLVLARRDHGLPFVPAVASVMAEKLGWSDARMDEEINALQKRLAWDLAATGG